MRGRLAKATPATDPEQRWVQVARLRYDQRNDLTDRVAGCLLLLYGQQLSRIAAMTTDQINDRDGTDVVRFGCDGIDLPDKLGIGALPGRRATMSHLAAHLPAAVLTGLLNSPAGTPCAGCTKPATGTNRRTHARSGE